MNKRRLLTSLILTFTFTIAFAIFVSTMEGNNIDVTAKAEVAETTKTESIVKTDNKTDKLSTKDSKNKSKNKNKKKVSKKKANKKTTKNKKNKKVKTKNKKLKSKKPAKKKKTKIVIKANTKKKGKKTSLKKLGTYKITGYCACSSCCGKNTGRTASGTRATAGRTIAADTSQLPFGTKVVIQGHTYVVEDVGGAVKGNHIDMFFSSHSKALEWGVRYCDVYLAQ